MNPHVPTPSEVMLQILEAVNRVKDDLTRELASTERRLTEKQETIIISQASLQTTQAVVGGRVSEIERRLGQIEALTEQRAPLIARFENVSRKVDELEAARHDSAKTFSRTTIGFILALVGMVVGPAIGVAIARVLS